MAEKVVGSHGKERGKGKLNKNGRDDRQEPRRDLHIEPLQLAFGDPNLGPEHPSSKVCPHLLAMVLDSWPRHP